MIRFGKLRASLLRGMGILRNIIKLYPTEIQQP